jgi:glycosyltransferase involved in cell wall biosynthesis
LFYRLASVFVLPSKGPGETWGLSVNEALASGTPVLVSSRCGCANDLVQEGINGYIFKSDDLIDLERKMLLCCDEAHLKFLAGNAVQSVENFSFQSLKESLDNINILIEK